MGLCLKVLPYRILNDRSVVPEKHFLDKRILKTFLRKKVTGLNKVYS